MPRKVNGTWKTFAIGALCLSALGIGALSYSQNQRYEKQQQAYLESLERQAELYDRLSRLEAERVTGKSQRAPEKAPDHTGLIFAIASLCGLSVLSVSGVLVGLQVLSHRQQAEIMQAMHLQRMRVLKESNNTDKNLKSAAVNDSEVSKAFQDVSPKQAEWILDFTSKAFHYRVNGPTGSGKSTFVKNLMDLIKLKMNLPHLEDFFTIIDPKYPFTDWGQMVPKYQDIETAYDGICDMYSQMLERLEIAKEAKRLNRPKPKFPPSFWLIDESDWVMLEHGKKATSKFKTVLKVARALNMVIVFFGQSPLCSDLGLRKNDFNNCGSIFLGSKNASMGIDEVCFKAEDKRRLQAEIAELDVLGVRYFALVKVDSSPAFLAPLPPPNYLAEIEQERRKSDAISVASQRIAATDSDSPTDSSLSVPKALPAGFSPEIADSIHTVKNSAYKTPERVSLSVPSASHPSGYTAPSSLTEDDKKRLERYWELKESGVSSKKDLVAKIFPDINGADKQGSRGYRKALKVLQSLPGVEI